MLNQLLHGAVHDPPIVARDLAEFGARVGPANASIDARQAAHVLGFIDKATQVQPDCLDVARAAAQLLVAPPFSEIEFVPTLAH